MAKYRSKVDQMLYHLISPWPCFQNHFFVRGWSYYMFLPSGIIFWKNYGAYWNITILNRQIIYGQFSIAMSNYQGVQIETTSSWYTPSHITRFNPHGKASRASMISGKHTPQEICCGSQGSVGLMTSLNLLGCCGVWVVLWKVVTLKSDGCGAWNRAWAESESNPWDFGTHIAFSRDWTNLISSTVYN